MRNLRLHAVMFFLLLLADRGLSVDEVAAKSKGRNECKGDDLHVGVAVKERKERDETR
jgi:hypothetical protein